MFFGFFFKKTPTPTENDYKCQNNIGVEKNFFKTFQTEAMGNKISDDSKRQNFSSTIAGLSVLND